jgi:putative phosphoribosyl transferase
MNRARYRDRRAAGRALLEGLAHYRGKPGVLVVGLARGGLPVAAEVAAGLRADLDVAVVRKLGVPGHEELALGALSNGRIVLNDDIVRSVAVTDEKLQAVIDQERIELARREVAYRGGRPPAEITGRTVILVDDGLATGATMHVAALDARAGGADRVVVAVPTAPVRAGCEFASLADEFVCPYTPSPFVAVGMSYQVFDQLDDDGVRAVLARWQRG